jgi:hypothetical protein
MTKSAELTGREVENPVLLAPAGAGDEHRRRDRGIGLLLFVGVLAVYLAVTRGTYYAYDATSMMAVTMNIVNHGTLKTTGFVDPFHQSTPYAPYGIGVSLLAVPLYAFSKAVGHASFLVSLINPVLMSFAVLMVYRTARALRWSAVHSVTAAVGFGLFTMALQSTTELFSEPGVTLCVVVLVYGVVRWREGDAWAPLWIGLAAAAAIQFRSDSLFTVWIGLLAIPLFVPWRQILTRRNLLLAGVPMGASLLLLVWYNELRDHKLLASSYGGSFTTSLGFGLHGLLFSPGKSIFVFNALTVLGVVGLGVLLVRDRPVAVLFLVLIVPRLFFFAMWSGWDGGWAWGPRFLLPAVPLLVLAAVELLRVWDRRSVLGLVTRGVAAVLACASAVVNVLSVRVPYEQWLQALATPATLARLGIPPPSRAQRLADYDAHFSTGPLWGNVTLLRHHLARMAPEWWAHGHSFVGYLLLAVAAGALVRAALGARQLDATSPDDAPGAPGEALRSRAQRGTSY